MPLVPMRLLLDHAAENDYGLAAFNVNNMEQIQAIMEAAKETESPVIVQASRGARVVLARQLPAAPHARRRRALSAASRSCMHQDHGNSPATCKSAIENGFTSVMMDGSLKEDGKTPADFDYNVKVTREVCEAGPRQGRFGRRRTRLPRLARIAAKARRKMATAPKACSSHDQLLTDPDEAERLRRRDRRRCAGRRHRHQPRRLQVHRASRPAKCWRWIASKRSTAACRTATW